MFGSKSYKKEVKEELEDSPLMFDDFAMKEKESYVYLGDVIHSGGMAASGGHDQPEGRQGQRHGV